MVTKRGMRSGCLGGTCWVCRWDRGKWVDRDVEVQGLWTVVGVEDEEETRRDRECRGEGPTWPGGVEGPVAGRSNGTEVRVEETSVPAGSQTDRSRPERGGGELRGEVVELERPHSTPGRDIRDNIPVPTRRRCPVPSPSPSGGSRSGSMGEESTSKESQE